MHIVLQICLFSGCIFFVANCGAQPPVPPLQFEGAKVTDCVPGKTGPPDHAIDGPLEAVRGIGEEIARFATAAGIPPLWCGPAADLTYRATWLPWSRPVRVANVRKVGNEWDATIVEFADPRKRAPGHRGRDLTVARRRESMRVESAPMEAFSRRFEIGQSLWDAPGWDYSSEVDDGPTWVLELRRGATYKLIVRNGKFDPLVDQATRALFEAAQAPIPDEKGIPNP